MARYTNPHNLVYFAGSPTAFVSQKNAEKHDFEVFLRC